MKQRTLLGLALLIIGVAGLFGVAALQAYWNAVSQQSSPWIGGPGQVPPGTTPRNYDCNAGMMGYGGMMGGRTGQVQSISMAQALDSAKRYIASLNNPDLVVKEIEEYQYNFYVLVVEKSTNRGAFELLVEKQGGSGMMGGMGGMMSSSTVHPEPQSMMWNTKYAMARGAMMQTQPNPGTDMTVSEEKAKVLASEYLKRCVPSVSVADAHVFYGYYTVMVEKDGKTYGMLSVNGYTGQAWWHWWHGAFIQEQEFQ